MRQVVYVRKNNNIIQINGKHYDANTGAPLKPSASTSKSTTKAKSIDGVRRTTRQPSHIASHRPKPSKTLMRHTVKKPSKATKSQLKANGQAELPATGIVISTPVQKLDTKRLQHAKKVHQSQLISRFGGGVEVKPQPLLLSELEAAKAIQTSTITKRPASHKKASKTTSDLLEQALQSATSHEQPREKQPHLTRTKRTAGIGGAVLLAVILLGVITTQNLPNARLQMASAKAGFDASLPQYKPAGYSLGKLNYSDGIVAVKFNSNSDDRSYTITQKQTTWDSTALRDDFVKPIDADYQTVDANGLTVYIYGQHNATWVNGGVWYQVESGGALSDRQLIDLANSL